MIVVSAMSSPPKAFQIALEDMHFFVALRKKILIVYSSLLYYKPL